MDGAMARTNRSEDDSEIADGLTRREHDILTFERQWWKYAGAKEEAIKEMFSMSATRYYQVLNALVDRPEALAADPMLVKRLRRLRASRQKARAARNRSESMVRIPATVFTRMGKMAPRNTMAIFDITPMPNQIIISGSSAMRGVA